MKTVNVKKLKAIINKQLANDFLRPEDRRCLAVTYGFLLSDLEVYGGFVFLPGEIDIHAGIYGKEGRVSFC